jgi:succinoglycan biosynthesis protein ExoA
VSAAADALQGRGRDVLIVIPTLDEARHIGSVVASLQADMACREALIVVSDGGSRDETVRVVQEIGRGDPRVKVIVNPGARGKGPAINVNAAARAFGQGRRWLVRVDAHAEYPPNYASGLVTAAEQTGATSVVTPLRTIGRTCFQTAAAAAQNSLLGTGGAAHRYGKSTEPRWVDHGHHALMDLAAFARVGGYDETFSHNEDAELDYRLTKAGGRIWLATDLPVGYFPRRTLKSLFLQYFRYGAGRARTHARHKGRLRLRQYIPIAVAPVVALALLTPVHPVFALPAAAWAGVCLLVGLASGRREGACGAFAGVPAMAMHLGWSLGYWSQVLRPTPDAGTPPGLVFAAGEAEKAKTTA